jgi:hypothetical protein
MRAVTNRFRAQLGHWNRWVLVDQQWRLDLAASDVPVGQCDLLGSLHRPVDL